MTGYWPRIGASGGEIMASRVILGCLIVSYRTLLSSAIYVADCVGRVAYESPSVLGGSGLCEVSTTAWDESAP